jgi:hypothetical protein
MQGLRRWQQRNEEKKEGVVRFFNQRQSREEEEEEEEEEDHFFPLGRQPTVSKEGKQAGRQAGMHRARTSEGSCIEAQAGSSKHRLYNGR